MTPNEPPPKFASSERTGPENGEASLPATLLSLGAFMSIPPLHEWPRTTAEAIALQKEWASRVDRFVRLKSPATLAACDVSFNKFDPWLYASVVVVDQGSRKVVETAGVVRPASFPYVPGLLSFREAPAVLDAFQQIQRKPDVILCDGQGIAHPRRFGLACHVGLWLGLPTVGVATSRLCGTHDDPGPNRGDRVPLLDKGEVIGVVLRTRTNVKPLYISPGHLCDIESAVEIVLSATSRFRLPDASRLAHDEVNRLRKAHKAAREQAGEKF